MTSSIPAASRRRRVMGWFGGDADASAVSTSPSPSTSNGARSAVQRQLYDDIGTLIFRHELTASPRTFGILHPYLTGEHPQIAAAVAALLREDAGLTDAGIAQIAEEAGASEMRPEKLSQIAEGLEQRIAECMTVVGASRDHAETFGIALHQEAQNFDSDPQATLRRVIALTKEAVAATRLVEQQLQQTRQEADELRNDLECARRAAEQDHLTGLPNRRSFESRLNSKIERHRGGHAVIGLIDIDDFKQVNDRFGHPTGDRVLKFVSTFLRDHLRKKVLVARFGGEEFALLFPDTPLEEAVDALDAVRERLSLRSLIHQESGEPIGHITFSAGLAIVGDDGPEALAIADNALYAAKKNGKNRVAHVTDGGLEMH